jgi:nicotinate-nucleotide adenylyltransferase
MKKVAILGGAFNPPTIGHHKLAELVLKKTDIDEVLVSPCYKHAFGKQMASDIDRIHMCKLNFESLKKVRIFTYETKNKFQGYTYDLIKELKNQYDYQWHFIVGGDNANNFSKWYKHKELKNMVNFIVVSRQGFKIETDWFLNGNHIYIENNNDIPMISSTEVKSQLKNNKKDIDGLHPYVLEYIKSRKLYED